MAPAQLIIFDCDGVLVDSETITNTVFTRLLNEAGWAISFEECCAHFKGRSLASCLGDIEAHLGGKLADDWLDRYRHEAHEALRAQVTIMPGAMEAIALVRRANIKMCIGSSGPMEKMKITLGRTGLWDIFEGYIFNSAMVSNGKPAPDLFLHAAQTMGVAPQSCLVIEDSPVGARAARAAKMTCLGYIGGVLKDEAGLAAQGAFLISDLQDVQNYL